MKKAAYAHAVSMYVQIWSIYEVFLRSFTREALNLYPSLLNSPENPSLAKRVAKASRKLGDTRRLGDLLVTEMTGHKDLRELILAFDQIGNAREVQDAFADPWLNTLERRRHIVAHKAGVIDEKYVTETGEGSPGAALPVSPFDTFSCYKATHSVAFQLAAELLGYVRA